MLSEFKGFLRERGVTTRQKTAAEIVELVAHVHDSSRTLPADGPLVERASAVWALLQELSDDDTDDERGEARVLPARGGVAARLRKMQSGRSDRALAALVPRGGPSSDANVELVVVPGTLGQPCQGRRANEVRKEGTCRSGPGSPGRAPPPPRTLDGPRPPQMTPTTRARRSHH